MCKDIRKGHTRRAGDQINLGVWRIAYVSQTTLERSVCAQNTLLPAFVFPVSGIWTVGRVIEKKKLPAFVELLYSQAARGCFLFPSLSYFLFFSYILCLSFYTSPIKKASIKLAIFCRGIHNAQRGCSRARAKDGERSEKEREGDDANTRWMQRAA